MDLDELLSFKPQKKLGKHSLEEEETQGAAKSSKKEDNGLSDHEKLLLLQSIDEDDELPGKVHVFTDLVITHLCHYRGGPGCWGSKEDVAIIREKGVA